MRLAKERNAVRIDTKAPSVSASIQEESPAAKEDVVLVPGQKRDPENDSKSFDFNNFLVIVPAKPIAISNLQKAWGRVSDAAKRTAQRRKSIQPPRISPLVSIKYKHDGKPSGKPSDWNTSAIRRVPFRGVQPRSSVIPAGMHRPILKRQQDLAQLLQGDKSFEACKLPVSRRAA